MTNAVDDDEKYFDQESVGPQYLHIYYSRVLTMLHNKYLLSHIIGQFLQALEQSSEA